MSSPPKSRLPLQVPLRILLLATAVVALHFGFRRGYLMTAFDLDEAIERARNIPIILAFAAAILAATFPAIKPATAWSAALCGGMLGSSVGFFSSLALAIEFGEMLRGINYWNWWRDWIWVAPHLIIATIQGGAVGAFVLQISLLLQYRWAQRKRAQVCRNAVFVKNALARHRRRL